MALHPAEEATLRAFVTADKRERFITLLSSGKRRRKALDSLNHFNSWDPRFTELVDLSTKVLHILRQAGAPSICHVIADDPSVDGLDLPLEEAVSAAEASSSAFVLCGLPGRVAIYFDEISAPRTRLLLRRPSTTA